MRPSRLIFSPHLTKHTGRKIDHDRRLKGAGPVIFGHRHRLIGTDNEQRGAALGKKMLAGVPNDLLRRTARLIEATERHLAPNDRRRGTGGYSWAQTSQSLLAMQSRWTLGCAMSSIMFQCCFRLGRAAILERFLARDRPRSGTFRRYPRSLDALLVHAADIQDRDGGGLAAPPCLAAAAALPRRRNRECST
jgi:hypothetical protein